MLVSEPRSGDKLGLQGLLSSFSKKNQTFCLGYLNAIERLRRYPAPQSAMSLVVSDENIKIRPFLINKKYFHTTEYREFIFSSVRYIGCYFKGTTLYRR